MMANYAYKVQPEQRAELISILQSDSTETLEELGQRFGITRERVRQIAVKNGIEVKRRFRARMVINTNKRVVHENFEEAYNAVWQEAERRGHKVKAWAGWNRKIYTSGLFINGRRCWISHIANASQPDPGGRYYAHTHLGESGTRIIVLDNKLDGRRYFYILLHFDRTDIYIPLDDSLRRNKRAFDYASLKNAWHLLAPAEQDSRRPTPQPANIEA